MQFKNDWTRYPIGDFKNTTPVSWKKSSNDSKVVEKAKFSTFDIFGDYAQKIDWLGFGIHISRQKKQIGVQFVLEVWDDIIEKVSKLFSSNFGAFL